MILVFSLESHINATGENGHSHPFPNPGRLVQMSLSIKKDVYTMWPLIEGNSCYDVLMLSNFFALRPIFTQIFAMPFGSRPLPINPGFFGSFVNQTPGGQVVSAFPAMHTPRLLVSAACGSGLAALSAPSSRPKSLAAPAGTAVCCAPGERGFLEGFFRPTFFPVLFFLLNPKKRPQGVCFPKMMGKSWPVRDNCRLLKWVVYISFDMSFDSSAIFSDALDINGLYAPRKSKLTVPTWKHRTSQNPFILTSCRQASIKCPSSCWGLWGCVFSHSKHHWSHWKYTIPRWSWQVVSKHVR